MPLHRIHRKVCPWESYPLSSQTKESSGRWYLSCPSWDDLVLQGFQQSCLYWEPRTWIILEYMQLHFGTLLQSIGLSHQMQIHILTRLFSFRILEKVIRTNLSRYSFITHYLHYLPNSFLIHLTVLVSFSFRICLYPLKV